MTDFLDRPVFPFRVERSQPLAAALNFDARAQETGFVGEGTDAFQRFAGRTADFVCALEGETDLQTLEAFLDALAGQQRGFWLASDERDILITAGISATQFRIEAQGLAAALDDWPGGAILFRLPDGTTQTGVIESVATDGNEEIVTLADALAAPPADDWTAEILRYVRLSDDAEISYQADHVARATLHVVEVPLEYEAPAEAPAARPAFLYEFSIRRDFVTWAYRLTSYPLPLTVGGALYTPAPVTHEALSTSTQGDQDTAQISLDNFAGNPFEDWPPRNIGPQVRLKISEIELDAGGAPTGDPKVHYRGVAKIHEPAGERMQISLVTVAALGRRQVPAMVMGSRCAYPLYDVFTCRVLAADYELEGTIAAIAADGTYIDFECADLAGKPADWLLPGGKFRTGPKPLDEVRLIIDSETLTGTRRRLWLNWPLRKAAVNDDASAWAACNHTTHCASRFDNFVNIGAQPFMPGINPSISTFPTTGTNTPKK